MSVNKCSLLNIGHVPFDVTYHINGYYYYSYLLLANKISDLIWLFTVLSVTVSGPWSNYYS